jgi:hypothetical protein
MQAGRWVEASARCEEAALVEAVREEALELLAEALRGEAEHRIEMRRRRATEEAQQAVERWRREVQAALSAGDWDRAAGRAEGWLARDSANEDARRFLRYAVRHETGPELAQDQAQAAGAAGGRLVPHDDEDDTVSIRQPRGGWWMALGASLRSIVKRVMPRSADQSGQTVVEWSMIAGVLAASGILFLGLAFGVLKPLVRWLVTSIRTIAP